MVSQRIVPARVGPEAGAIPLLKFLEPRHHGSNATRARVVQRATTKWRKAGSEDHAVAD